MAAAQRLLALISGRMQDYVPLIASTGVASSGAVPALNAAGLLDVSFMPPGLGADVATLTASEAIAAGAYVNVWNNAGVFAVRNADGSVAGKQADGFTLGALASGASGLIYFQGINIAVTGQVPGLVFLSDTAVGAAATTGATAAGHTYQQIGLALSATSVQFDPQVPIGRA